MNDRDTASFDPRTWIDPGAGPRAGQVADETSFDIRSWGAAGAVPPAPPPPPAKERPARDRTVLLAAGAGLSLAIAGAGIAYLGRQPAPVADAASAAVSAPLAPAAFSSRRTLVLSDVREVEGALRSAGIVADEAAQAGRRTLAALGTSPGEIRTAFDLKSDGSTATLLSLEVTRQDGAGLVLRRGADGALSEKRLTAALERRLSVVRGEMDSRSFYSSAVAAGVTDSLISDFANAFSFDFDMQREVAPGDVFEAAFEQAYNPSGEAVGVPRLVYVSLQTASKSRTLYRFTPPGEREAGWFDGNGFSTVRALMRTPVDSARITSQFGMRTHPILGYQKMHRGTDFAAPTGTPIFASGGALVEFAGPKGANGNFVRLRHDNGWETLYLHMNRILPGVVPGARVAQGQQIGEIGTTGRSTGPHLHYEVHVEGQPVDPLSIETGTGQSLAGTALAAFHKERDGVDARRAGAGS